ncbi:helix-turn-helix domain-containing protein [Stappia sp. F7233]|uniref:Helix-turn-helix domain-containing protein n=1 Tax=Stappia albiluteola TaxID=2758565 RepID=A0A839AGM9_9HYPH|nr:helix-turn-helix domain-containing protein [Stappia albiluteola]MBA5778042.1 helix-turn-helix domain-containing protein [Stappia albiluteola]
MGRKYPSPHRLKSHRSYTYAEAAKTLGVDERTVRSWVKDGLPAISDQRPHLIEGHALKAHLKAKRRRRRHPCGAGEFFCLGCKAPRKPAFGEADFHPGNNGAGRIIALCGTCSTVMSQHTRETDLAGKWSSLKVSFKW